MAIVDVAGERVELLAGRAVRWGDTLLVADVHLGKVETFRLHGIPVPGAHLEEDLGRLDALLVATGARRLVVLGDLVHGRHGVTAALVETVAAWRRARPVSMVLVRGNHDRHLPSLPEPWGIEEVEGPLRDGPFAFVHEPKAAEGAYTWAGHLHPGVTIGEGVDRMCLPCFHLGARVGVLPAFGTFTGSVPVRPAPRDRVYALAGDRVAEIRIPIRR